VTTTLSIDDLSGETGVPRERLEWMTELGILHPTRRGAFRSGDVFRVKLVAALLDGGFTSEQIEWAASEGHLNLDGIDAYQLRDPGPWSGRTFAEFMAAVGPRGRMLPAIYAALGIPQPDPDAPLHVDEEELLAGFLRGWSPAPSDDALIRAARLVAEGTRMAVRGWADLADEQVAAPARERLYRGEGGERFPGEVRETFLNLLARIQPRMIDWLIQRNLDDRTAEGIVSGFERFFASRGVGPPPQPSPPPAVVFVDLSGYTRLTEERGDHVAVSFASTLQRHSVEVAAANDGRLVKLLGDGAMLRLPDARRGVTAATSLVRVLNAEGGVAAHAGVHAGPVIERDLDLFGNTVNLASRIAERAGPGEVLASEAVIGMVDDPTLRFERTGPVQLKGIADAVTLYRVTAGAAG
jgi:adenylate cyclase